MEVLKSDEAPRYHGGRALLSLAKGAALFVVMPIAAIQVLSSLITQYNLPVSSSVTSIATEVAYIGMSIAATSFFASLLGNERLSGLSLRAVSQMLVAFYAVYIVGREYSFIVEGQVSFNFSILPIAFAFAGIALLRIVPCMFEHFEKKHRAF